VTLTVTDTGNLTGTVAHDVTVVANVAPTAAFSSLCSYLVCSFDGSGSTDSDGTVVSYSWNFGDGTPLASGATPAHAYAAAGTYSVSVTVTDNASLTGTISHSVVAVSPPVVDDGFDRSVTGAWGTAPVGGAWSVTSGPASDFAVAGSAGSILLSAAGNGRGARLLGVSTRDLELESVISASAASTGFGEMTSLVGRRVATNREYRLRVRFAANGQVLLGAVKLLGTSTEVAIGAEIVVPGLTFAPGTKYRVRARFVGASPTVISASIWIDGNAAPGTWQLTQTDSESTLQVAGAPGVHAVLSSSATTVPVTITFDSFIAKPL
jgi:PKD repeat protein